MVGDGRAVPAETYFYDLNEGEVFTAKPQPGPIKAPSGATDAGEPAGVSAAIYACGGCDASYKGMSPRQIADAGARLAYLKKGGQVANEGAGGEELIAAPSAFDWVPRQSSPGQQIQQVEFNCKPGVRPQYCYPSGP